MSKLLRVWEEVARIQCEATKYAIATCNDLEVLARLNNAFPECFREGRDDEADRYSWKRICRAARKYSSRDKEPARSDVYHLFMWHHHFRVANLDDADRDLVAIPVLADWGTIWYGQRGARPPQCIIDQLVEFHGEFLTDPMFVDFEGINCVVGCIWFEYGGENPGYNRPFKIDPNEDGPHELVLIPADAIAFDC